ncbi:hypothetical protein Back11_38690 [Paenibacillus baekrokdamisoli]|uniref:Uncharacterized protein n=1 Tax=Paenibacillus baekrokdamisoli TaxID=1712516 RepID=A0A3G9JHK8_9BACL|nr:hypothetical protein [Paenibacillus baekrokdamisoli]MBB3068431.1 hypothetical protein [Paenibacillus baekrokdamisoli]BBH22524.1 hypothetical protein Back11_38690 [Paenibacillus baekrokdamisoli]
MNVQPFTKCIHAKTIALHLLMNNEEAAEAHEREMRVLFTGELGVLSDIDMRVLALNPLSAF